MEESKGRVKERESWETDIGGREDGKSGKEESCGIEGRGRLEGRKGRLGREGKVGD